MSTSILLTNKYNIIIYQNNIDNKNSDKNSNNNNNSNNDKNNESNSYAKIIYTKD